MYACPHTSHQHGACPGLTPSIITMMVGASMEGTITMTTYDVWRMLDLPVQESTKWSRKRTNYAFLQNNPHSRALYTQEKQTLKLKGKHECVENGRMGTCVKFCSS